jgi:iron complex outermembrane receptor protein
VIISRNWGDQKADLKPEKMVDIELGYTWTGSKGAISANVYLMEYWDMLLETGKLSDVGYAIKENVGRSYRRGIELAGAWTPLTWLQVDANTTLSTNKILDFVGYFDRIDSDWNYLDGQQEIAFGKTDILMSPSVVGMLQLTFRPLRQTSVSLNGKYVGEQYIDNTSSRERMIPDYFVANLSATHTFDLGAGTLEASAYVNNIFNHLYYADGWTYNVYDCDKQMIIADMGIFPQAPANFMLKLAYRF